MPEFGTQERLTDLQGAADVHAHVGDAPHVPRHWGFVPAPLVVGKLLQGTGADLHSQSADHRLVEARQVACRDAASTEGGLKKSPNQEAVILSAYCNQDLSMMQAALAISCP